MCGIVGVHLREGRVEGARLRRMADAIRHRGPDAEGFHEDGPVGLGMRRLSIIDLSSGNQPMTNEDGSIVVVFNGEIYNYRALRRELCVKGHKLVTESDTEVIPHLYEEYGVDFARRLDGMFAIAIWDRARRRLILARDRVGIKPLYYTMASHGLVFASEIKGMRPFLDEPLSLDREALRAYLLFQYVPAPMSPYVGVRKLPPGHVLVSDASGVGVHRYWRFEWRGDPEMGLDEACALVRGAVERSVVAQMQSDVPYGAFLSGGLDSSIVVSIMARSVENPIRTFTVGFDTENPRLDETAHAAATAAHFQTEHETITIREHDALAALPDLLYHNDEPVAEGLLHPSHAISRLARRKVKLVLTGEGSDELFFGYERYKVSAASRALAYVPTSLLRPCRAAVGFAPLPETWSRNARSLLYRDRKEAAILRALVLPPQEAEEAFSGKHAIPPLDQPRRLASPDAFAPGARREPEVAAGFDFNHRLPDYILTRMDKMTMAASLEGRVPFLGNDVLEAAARVPPHWKLRGVSEKYVLRKAFANTLPRDVLKRRKKAFGAPTFAWAETLAERVLADSHLVEDSYLSRDYVDQARDARDPARGHRLWSLGILETWYRRAL